MSNVVFLEDITEEDYLEVFLVNQHHVMLFDKIEHSETFFVPFKAARATYRTLRFRNINFACFQLFKGSRFVNVLNYTCITFDKQQWQAGRDGIKFEKTGILEGTFNYV